MSAPAVYSWDDLRRDIRDAKTIPEGCISFRQWIDKHVYGMTDEQVVRMVNRVCGDPESESDSESEEENKDKREPDVYHPPSDYVIRDALMIVDALEAAGARVPYADCNGHFGCITFCWDGMPEKDLKLMHGGLDNDDFHWFSACGADVHDYSGKTYEQIAADLVRLYYE